MKVSTTISKNVSLHNIGFYKPQVRAINCMQLQPEVMHLAVSRSDNSIEIWNVAHLPFLQRIIIGRAGSSVEDLQWCGTRLFSCGFQGAVDEHSLYNGDLKSSTSVTGGVAWTLAYNSKVNLFAVGTEDGFINILEVTDDGLEYLKLLDKQQGRVLCMSWDESGTHLVTGSVDVVRVWNLSSGHAVHKMATGRSHSNRETVVWALTVTADFTIVSGDSRGCLTFWDGKLGTQVDSFRSHDADILTVCLTSDGTGLVCAGVDPVLAVYGKVSHCGGKRQWARGGLHRLHHHDVRAIVTAPDGRIFSGGVSGFLIVINKEPKLRLSLPPFLKGSCAQVVPKLKQLLLRYSECVQLWLLGSAMTDSSSADSPLLLSSKPKCLLRVDAKAGEVILCAAVSPSGNNIAFSSQKSLQFYNVKLSESYVNKLDEEFGASSHISFYLNGEQEKCLAITNDNNISVLDVTDQLAEEVHNFQPAQVSCVKDAICHLSISPCGALFVLADCSSNVAIWSTTSWTTVASLPHYAAVPTALAFSLESTSVFIAYSDLKVFEFNIKQKKYTEFSDKLSTSGVFHSPITGILVDPRRCDGVVLHDDTSLCAITNQNVGVEELMPSKVPRKSGGSVNPARRTCIVKKFQYIADAAWVENDELLLVEVTPLSLTESLTPFFMKKKFGT